MPKIPSRALTQICTTSHQPEMFSNSSAGLYAKMYGTMKAAMANTVILVHLPVVSFPIYSLVFMTVYC